MCVFKTSCKNIYFAERVIFCQKYKFKICCIELQCFELIDSLSGVSQSNLF